MPYLFITFESHGCCGQKWRRRDTLIRYHFQVHFPSFKRSLYYFNSVMVHKEYMACDAVDIVKVVYGSQKGIECRIIKNVSSSLQRQIFPFLGCS